MTMDAAYDTSHRRSKKKVTFGRIEVYEHCYEMGDSPSVSDGAPLTIGWELQCKRIFDSSYFETYNPSEARRKQSSMQLSVAQRAKILLRQGYTMNEIVECTIKVMQEKRRRDQSVKGRKWDGWNALMEKTTRSLGKVARRPRRPSLDRFINDVKATGRPPTPEAPPKAPRGRRTRRVSLGQGSITDSSVYVPFSPLKSPANKKKMKLERGRDSQSKAKVSLTVNTAYHKENLQSLGAFLPRL